MVGKYQMPIGKIGPRQYWAHFEQLDDRKIKMTLKLPFEQTVTRVYPRVLHARMKAVALAFFRKAKKGEKVDEGTNTVELAVNEAGSIERIPDSGGDGKPKRKNTGGLHDSGKRKKRPKSTEPWDKPDPDVAKEGDTEDS